jgi:outer membrane cobalamin receptor
MDRLARIACIIIVLSTFLSVLAHAQVGGIDTTRGTQSIRIPGRVDSLARPAADTLHGADTAASRRAAIPARRDSVVHVVPFRSVGSLSPATERYTTIDADGILWNDYRTLTDLLSSLPGIFVNDKGSPGQENPVTFAGAGFSATEFLVDGISHNEPFTGTYDFALFPVEAVERLEVVTGTRAFLYGDDAAGGAINVVTKSFSNNRPFTRIRYSQANNSYTQTDALFSQNIFARFNLMFGLSYLGYGQDNAANAYEGRYPNAASGAYTFRTKLRYNVSPTVNVEFTHFYHQSLTNLNGGVDIINTPPVSWFDEANAKVINTDAYEKRFNHHAALTGVYRPTGDSTLSATVTVFGSDMLRQYRDEENRLKPNGVFVHDNFEASVIGALAQSEWTWGGNALSASAESRETQYERSIFGMSSTERRQRLSVKDELSPFRFVTVAGFIKVEDGQKQILENFGADGSIRISDVLSATAGASQAHRRPTKMETYLASGAADTTIAKILQNSQLVPWQSPKAPLLDEIHHVAELGLRFTPHEQFVIGLTASRRTIDNWIDNSLITPHQGQNVTFTILTPSLQTHLGRFFLDASAEYTHQTDLDRGDRNAITTMQVRPYPNAYKVLLYPEWRGQCSLYFRGTLAKGNLDMKAGVNARFWSAYDGEQYRFVDGVPNPTFRQSIGNAGMLDVFLIAHLGDAQIHVIMENVTNTGYMLAPFYPMFDRGFRFGVSWEFWD